MSTARRKDKLVGPRNFRLIGTLKDKITRRGKDDAIAIELLAQLAHRESEIRNTPLKKLTKWDKKDRPS